MSKKEEVSMSQRNKSPLRGLDWLRLRVGLVVYRMACSRQRGGVGKVSVFGELS